MRSLPRCSAAVLLAAALLTLMWAGCAQETDRGHDHSDGGHAHGEDAHAHDEGSSVLVTAWTDAVEIFAEHPVLEAGVRSDPWAIHVTALSDYRPVTEGTLTLRFRRPDGAAYVHTADAPSRPGIFTPQPEIPEAGTFRLFAIVQSPAVRDTVEVGDVTVHASAADANVSSDEPEISFLKEQQWKTDFGVARAREQSVRASIVVPGAIQPVPDRYAQVAAPVAGRVPAERAADLPAPGDRVRAGQMLGVLAPSSSGGSYADLKARVERLRREVRRAQRLYDAEAVPEKQLIEARHDLEVATAALESMGDQASDGFDYTLRAPMTGYVHERHLVPGSQVDAGTVLYTLVDPSRVRIRLRVPARHASRLDDPSGATFTVEGNQQSFRADRVVSVGTALDPGTRTLPVYLETSNPNGRLKLGMMVEANLFTDADTSGVAIPNDAIQMEDGRPVAYVQTGGEGFDRRPLRLGPTDGTVTLVERGIQAGEHVVTAGAYQVYLASLNTAEVGGHGHPH